MDIELLYCAIKKATLPDLELFKRTGHMPFFERLYRHSKKGLDNSSPFFMFHVEHYILVAKSKEIHPAPLLSFPQPAVLP